MADPRELDGVTPDQVFDGGDLDCGSGLILLIRDAMSRVPEGGILEMRSREPTVAADLPPWCRMVGHAFLGARADGVTTRFFVRKGAGDRDDGAALRRDQERANEFEWRVRARATGPMETTAYFRNFSFKIGQSASFEEKDAHPSALELVLSALAADLAGVFATQAARCGLEIDDVEITVKGRLESAMAHLGLEAGDPGLAQIELSVYVSTLEDERRVREAFAIAAARSPLLATLRKAAAVREKLVIG
jgi:uncharacterized OsmC-like protein/TusA-related sulfurtransferase